jgi:plastocyanin
MPPATNSETSMESMQNMESADRSTQDEMADMTGRKNSEELSAASSEDEYAGTHIMPDGTIMMVDGTVITRATIQTDGTILLSTGTVITPAFDMRKDVTETDDEVTKAVVIDMVGTDFSYDVKQITVKKGDTVTINFRSDEGFHDWVIDEFDAATQRVNEGGTTSVTFVADEIGTFQYYCSVMSHREMGMVGYLEVKER